MTSTNLLLQGTATKLFQEQNYICCAGCIDSCSVATVVLNKFNNANAQIIVFNLLLPYSHLFSHSQYFLDYVE